MTTSPSKRLDEKIKLLQSFGCASCGMPTQSKKLRPSDSGGYEIFCRDCVQEGKAIAQMTDQEREEYL